MTFGMGRECCHENKPDWANFVDNLAADYKMATNSEYKSFRASLSAKEVRVVCDAPTFEMSR
jgi:hypothetical protein